MAAVATSELTSSSTTGPAPDSLTTTWAPAAAPPAFPTAVMTSAVVITHPAQLAVAAAHFPGQQAAPGLMPAVPAAKPMRASTAKTKIPSAPATLALPSDSRLLRFGPYLDINTPEPTTMSWQMLPLYNRTQHKSAQVWQVGFDGSHLWAISGFVEGKMRPPSRLQVKTNQSGKTIVQQAWQKASSDFRKKWRHDYRYTLADSDSHGASTVKLQLAIWWEPDMRLNYPVGVLIKLDGVRVSIQDDGKGDICFKSRNTLEFALPHLRDPAKLFKAMLPAGACVDAEVYNHQIPHQDLVGAVKQEKSISPLVQYARLFVFDVALPDQKTLTFGQRYQLLIETMNKYRQRLAEHSIPIMVYLMNLFLAYSPQEIEAFMRLVHGLGYEGVVIRPLEMPYKGGRNNALLKHKPDLDAEFKVKGVELAEGGHEGAAIFILELKDGRTFRADPMGEIGSLEQRRQFALHPKTVIGRRVTVLFSKYSKDGIPVHPRVQRFRDVM